MFVLPPGIPRFERISTIEWTCIARDQVRRAASQVLGVRQLPQSAIVMYRKVLGSHAGARGHGLLGRGIVPSGYVLHLLHPR